MLFSIPSHVGRHVSSRCRLHCVPSPGMSLVVKHHSGGMRPISVRNSIRVRQFSAHAAQPPPFAFAFDIDGVLLRESTPIAGATETLNYLQKQSIPFILLTNGGGKHDEDRVKDLSNKLKVDLSTDNFVQSHSPFRQLVGDLGEKNVLVTGSDGSRIREIANRYGFKSVITPADILMEHPKIWPFEPLKKSIYGREAMPLRQKDLKVDAIFVFNDPRDWALDIQLIVDLLVSQNGVLGTYSSKNGREDLPGKGWQTDGQPPVFFSNPDLFWSTEYHQPRFGQGAFQGAINGVWKAVTGGQDLKCTIIGKPHKYTFEFAERTLNTHRMKLLGASGANTNTALQRVYMVGDNPESDIRGANEFQGSGGATWKSILVKTGVWDSQRGSPSYSPDRIENTVTSAVRWAARQEGWAEPKH